jgi:tripartite-type tricarboxylate transporter receptor subunit TctC
VGKDVPVNTMREFVALAKTIPGKLNYGSAGAGSCQHLALELLNARAGIVVVHVPYRGIADATKDLLGGSIQAMTASIPAALPLAADRKVKVLAVTGRKRIPQLPDVPSWAEEGVPDANVINYWGIVAPRGRRARSSRASTPRCRKCSRSPKCASVSSAKARSSCRARRISSARSSSTTSRTGRS